MAGETYCKSPHKVAFKTRAEALTVARTSRYMRDCRAFRCQAGHWHLTSQSKKAKSYR